MLKILRVGNYPTDFYNTVASHAYWLNANPNFETTHISPNIKGTPLPVKGTTEVFRYSFLNIPRPKKANITVRALFNLLRIFKIFTFSFKSFRHLRGKDIVHLHSPMYLIIGAVAYLFGCKVYITFHGEDIFRIENSRLYRLFSNIFSAAFILSPEIRSLVGSLHKCPVIDVDNGIDTKFYRNLARPRKKQLLMVSAFKAQKGHKIMLDSFKKFLTSHPDYHLVLVGEGILEKELKAYCRSTRLASKVTFSGYLPADRILDLYNESEIFVLPSLWEGFPKVLLEAMACGCKVVCTRVDGAIKVLPKDYRYLIKCNDSADLHSALLNVCGDTNYDFKQQETIALGYTWEKISSPYLAQYKSDLLSRR